VWATGVSNPICSPHFHGSVSINDQISAFAQDVPTHIFLFYQYLGHSLIQIIIPVLLFIFVCLINHTISKIIYEQPTRILYPVHLLNTFPLCLTAAAGTEFARDFIFYSSFLNKKINKGFDNLPSPYEWILWISYLLQKCSIKLSLIVKYSPLLPLMWMGRVAVPLWPIPQQGRLWIFGLDNFPTT